MYSSVCSMVKGQIRGGQIFCVSQVGIWASWSVGKDSTHLAKPPQEKKNYLNFIKNSFDDLNIMMTKHCYLPWGGTRNESIFPKIGTVL